MPCTTHIRLPVLVLLLVSLVTAPDSAPAHSKCGAFRIEEPLILVEVDGDISGLGLDMKPVLAIAGSADGPIGVAILTDSRYSIRADDEIPQEDMLPQQ